MQGGGGIKSYMRLKRENASHLEGGRVWANSFDPSTGEFAKKTTFKSLVKMI